MSEIKKVHHKDFNGHIILEGFGKESYHIYSPFGGSNKTLPSIPYKDIEPGWTEDYLIEDSTVKIGKNVKIGKDCVISAHSSIRNNVIIEDNVTLERGVKIWGNVHIGANTIIKSGSIIKDHVIIEENAYIPENVIIKSYDIVKTYDNNITVYYNEYTDQMIGKEL